MGFFNSLSIRITLAILGGAMYALLTYGLLQCVNLSSPPPILFAAFVYLFYLGSRLLLLFSGIDSPYYRREKEGAARALPEKDAFQATAQWVGKFYHQHDVVLFVFLVFLAVAFLISLVIDGLRGIPAGGTIQDLWNALSIIP